jgi:hypothetical protein
MLKGRLVRQRALLLAVIHWFWHFLIKPRKFSGRERLDIPTQKFVRSWGEGAKWHNHQKVGIARHLTTF